MKTTLKRGVGRGAHLNGNGKAVFPPGAISAVTRYRQPPPGGRSRRALVGRVFLFGFLAVLSLVLAVAGGAYLYAHQTVEGLRAHTPEVVRAAKKLDVPLANAPAIALVIGYDHRAGEGNAPSRSDTIMLARADPITKTISLLSFPRDLEVPIYCGATPIVVDRINSAYARCQETGTLLTIRHLTGLPINYLITVNFHGFKELVDKLGGVWMDVDRRYYNRNTGAYYNDYANINLQPGYQLLSGQEALDFVRFRHTDSDLVRNARQQEFVRSFREQIARSFSPFQIPSLVSTIEHNVEIGEGGHSLSLDQVLSYALFAQSLPSGHFFQDHIQNVQCQNTCTVDSASLQQAITQFTTPDVGSSKAANAAALGEKPRQTVLPPSKVTVTVLNGNGVAGMAANTSYALGQLGYQMLVPPNGLAADAPTEVFHTKIYYDPAQRGAQAAAKALQALMQPADVARLPRTQGLLTLDPGSMLLVVLGTAFHGQVAPAPVQVVPVHQPPAVRFDPSYGTQLLQPLARRVPFRLMVPTVLESTSYPDTQPGDTPARLYWIDAPMTADRGHHKAVRLVFKGAGLSEYWGIEETNWSGAPALADRSFRHDLGGREFDLYYSGPHLHMIVLHAHGASYWVVNDLMDDLSNETMIAIAKGLKPLTTGK